jgi:phosphotriesterase-related protein
MPHVETTLGPRQPEQLGTVLMHEHVIFGLPGADLDPLHPFDRQTVTRRAIDRLTEARQAGLGTLVDLTAIGVMRDIDLMRTVSKRSGVPIVACTGFWLARGIPQHFADLQSRDLASIMLHELRGSGIGNSGVHAGIIKVATSKDAIHPLEERVLHAAAWAQRETGCCISTHTTGSSMGPEQVAILTQEGVDLRRVVIGHCDDRDDLDYLHRLLDLGITAQFDHIGANSEWTLPDARKVELLASLVAEGFAPQLTLSHDSLTHVLGLPDDSQPLHRRPSYLLTEFRQQLLQAGVSEAALHQMQVANPARLLPF